VAAALPLLLLGACSEPVPSTGGASADAPGAPSREELFDRLASLPYAGAAPPDAHDDAGVLVHEPERVLPGRLLYASRGLCTAHLVDRRGRRLRTWTDPGPCRKWAGVELLRDGGLLVVGAERFGPRDGIARRLEAHFLARLGRDGTLRWRRHIPVHHELDLLPGRRRAVVLLARHRQVPELDPEIPLRDAALGVVRLRDGKILEEWSLYDGLAAAPEVDLRDVTPVEQGGEPELDLLHPNSVEWLTRRAAKAAGLPSAGPLALVTFRNQNLVAAFGTRSREVAWAWGQDHLEGPHGARALPPGRLLVFDNGLVRGWSRVLEVATGTGRIAAEMSEPRFYTRSRGAAQRLPNGNTLVSDSANARAFEWAPDGDVVWEFVNPDQTGGGRPATFLRMSWTGSD
jgi:hypothetical protein